MNVDLTAISDLLAKHHLVELVGAGTILWIFPPPLLVTFGDFCVEITATGRAVAKKAWGITDEHIDAERPKSQVRISAVPEDVGIQQKILGVTGLRASDPDRRSA